MTDNNSQIEKGEIMKLFWINLLLLSLAVFMVGCGSDSSTDPFVPVETGSSSLLVDAGVDGSDLAAGVFFTFYYVFLTDSLNAPVTDAAVSMSHSVLGTINLDWDTLTASTYIAGVFGYEPGTYTLNILRGTDFLNNGRVVAPDIHVITYPTVNDTIPLNTAFTTLWTRTTIADLVEVSTRDYGPVLSTDVSDTDDGSFLIPGSNTVRDDQRVRITRSNTVNLTRGWTGSTFSAKIRNSIEPFNVRN